uniref:Tyrosine-protein phosphatase domain-containing protein n=1 Tax=Parastrongyloides trichosuri TaxID=131310 RepID=A0A0N4ZWQ1_PARTI
MKFISSDIIIQIFSTLLILFGKVTAENGLFPSAPTNVESGNLYYTLNHDSSYDVIMIKCPDSQYKYSDKMSVFILHDNYQIPIGFERRIDRIFVWSAVRNTNLNETEMIIICGYYLYEDSNMVLKKSSWNIYVEWNKNIDMINNVHFQLPSEVRDYPENSKCRKPSSELIKISINKDMRLYSFKTFNDADLFVKQFIYFFDKVDVSRTGELAVPCDVVRMYATPPEINIINNEMHKAKNMEKIFVVNSTFHGNRTYQFKLEIKNSPDLKNFYAGETVIINKIKYKNGEIKIINNTKYYSSEIFTVDKFEILEFIYPTITRNGSYEEVKRIIFFGPENRNFVLKHEVYQLIDNDQEVQAHCSMNIFSYGYLVAMKANNITTNVTSFTSEGQTLNGLTKRGDFFIHIIKNESLYKLNCIYQTPDGNVILPKVYSDSNINITIDDRDEKPIVEDKNLQDINGKKYKPLKKTEKSVITKLREKLGDSVFFGLIAGAVIIILLGCFLICFFGLRKIIPKCSEERRRRLMYANIFSFWNNVKMMSLREYSKVITDEKYVSSKVKNIKIIKNLDNEDFNLEGVDYLFNATLIRCYKMLKVPINAHYVSSIPQERNYIISDGPRKDTIGEFFKMLFLEDVAVVVAIFYKDLNNPNAKAEDKTYWPNKTAAVYDDIKVEYVEDTNNDKNINIRMCFKLTYQNKEQKTLIIYHVSDWKEYDMPLTTKFLTELYKSVSECAGKRTVLIHNSQSVGSRAFIFTFFSCIFEKMIENSITENPMEIIKEIRENCFGGNISRIEFAYIITTLIENFFDKGYLIDKDSIKLKFFEDFNAYVHESPIAIKNARADLIELLKFLLVSDQLKVAEVINQCKRVQVYPLDVLETKCQRHLKVMKTNSKNKLRYPRIYCLDYATICISGVPANDVKSFIHANEMIYDMAGGKKRKLIMCQAPLPTTIEDMLDVLYNYKVGIIVILVNQRELNTEPPKWTKYLPYEDQIFNAGNYTVNRVGNKAIDIHNISEMDCRIFFNQDTSQCNHFKVYHYEGWPDKSVPKKTNDVLELLKRVMNDQNSNRYIVIHCSTGIGRTGTFALALLMIDTILSSGWFNPIKSLNFLRKHRHRAVQTDSQFAFAINLVLDFFRNEIMNIDKKLLSDFEELLKIYLD